MTKTQKIWLWVSLAMFVVPEVLWGGLASTFLQFKPIFDLSLAFDKFPVGANIFLLPEIIAIVSLISLNQQYQHKSNLIKYLLATLLITSLVIFVALGYILYMFHYASFP